MKVRTYLQQLFYGAASFKEYFLSLYGLDNSYTYIFYLYAIILLGRVEESKFISHERKKYFMDWKRTVVYVSIFLQLKCFVLFCF